MAERLRKGMDETSTSKINLDFIRSASLECVNYSARLLWPRERTYRVEWGKTPIAIDQSQCHPFIYSYINL